MRHFILTLFVLFLFDAHGQSLSEYLQTAAENNPGLKAQYLEFEAALQKVDQVNTLPDPSLSFGYFISPVETRVGPQRAKLSLSQMFPWFGTLKARGDAATLVADAKFQEFVNSKNVLFLNVKKAYYPLYELNEHIRWQQENLEILKTYKALATTSFSNGKGSMADVIRVDIMIDNAETSIQILNDQIRPLEIAFNRLLNQSDSLKVNIESDNYQLMQYSKMDFDSLLAAHPMLKTLDLKIQSTQAQEELARKNGLPQIGVGLDYVFVDERSDMNVEDNGKNVFMPMVTMTLPIFRKKYNSSVKEMQLQQEALSMRKTDQFNQLVSSYETTWFEMEKAKQLIDLYDEQVIKTRQAIDLLHTAYSNSGKDFEEVLRMQQQLLQYEMARATAVKNYLNSTGQLDYLTSKSEFDEEK